MSSAQDRIARMRAKQAGSLPAGTKPSATLPPDVPPPAPMPAAEKPKKPKADAPTMKRSCGHETKLFVLASQPCSNCVGKALAKARATRRARKEAKAIADGAPPSWRKLARDSAARLPNGSRFSVGYDDEKQEWTGFLTVPVAGGEPVAVEATAGGVFRLLAVLDGLYRERVAQAVESVKEAAP